MISPTLNDNLSWKSQFSSVELLSRDWLFATPWTAACQASLHITNSWSLFKPMSIESVMPSKHPILCHPLLLLPSMFPSIRVFSNESDLCIRWPKCWSFSFNISPSNEHPGLISLQSKGLSRVFSNSTVQKHQFFGAQLSLQSNLDHSIQSHHFMANRWGNSGNSGRLYFLELQNYCRWCMQPRN